MNMWELPTSLEIGGVGFPICTDFRDVLYLMGIFSDPDYEQDEKGAILLRVMFEDWEAIPVELHEEALEKAMAFIDAGIPEGNGKKRPRTVDWEQDGPIILPAVNRVLGQDVRGMEYLHWWTFLGAYMEIGESLFSTVLGIRQKKAKGKKLEKYEQEFYTENKSLITIRRKETEADRERRDELKKLFV